MSRFSLSLIELLIEGIPESFLFVFAVYIFTKLKFDIKKYLLINLALVVVTYITRWLPINLGTHTMLTLLVLIVLFIVINKVSLQYVVRSIVSVITLAVMVVASELLNLLLFIALFGQKKSEQLLNSNSPLTKDLGEIPSIVIFAAMIFTYCFVSVRIDKHKKDQNGNSGTEDG